MNKNLVSLLDYAGSIREPENLFSGKQLSHGFVPPDNMLVFFHDFTAPAPNSHGRHTLVVPFDRMTYYVGRSRISMEPGCILYVPPYETRFLRPDSCGFRRLFITFEAPAGQNYLPKPGVYSLGGNVWDFLNRFLLAYKNSPAESISGTLMLFLQTLSDIRPAGHAETVLPVCIERTVEKIETDLSAPLDMKSLSVHAGLSESRLRTLFREYIGVSLGSFVARKKLDYAKYCLINTEMTIAEIAAGCGFANVFVFGTFFKRNTGVPPLRFRLQNTRKKETVPRNRTASKSSGTNHS